MTNVYGMRGHAKPEARSVPQRPHYEYRVRWQRKNRLPNGVLRQTEKGARAKAEALMWSDTQEGQEYYSNARVVFGNEDDNYGPVQWVQIDRRTVGKWEIFKGSVILDVPKTLAIGVPMRRNP